MGCELSYITSRFWRAVADDYELCSFHQHMFVSLQVMGADAGLDRLL